MKNVVLYDSKEAWQALLPLTYTRPISHLKVGIVKIYEKWELLLNQKVSFSTIDYLTEKHSVTITDDNIVINSQVLPTANLIKTINRLELNDVIYHNDIFIATRINKTSLVILEKTSIDELDQLNKTTTNFEISLINRPFDIFSKNGEEIISDYDLLTKNKESEKLNETNTILGSYPIHISKGAEINCSIFNATEGPIYIGKYATIMEGSMIRGPFAMGDHSTVKMGAKIYKNTSIGDYCKIGGELNNVVMFSYSNKGHEGYLGNAVIGEWCNLGADTNNSNLKNNYSEVKLWSYVKNRFEKTGLQFCGLVMGDHSKCGINTMFNTGTVIGVSTNLYGAGYQKNFIPSFTWGEPKKLITYRLDKVIEVAEIVMNRRNIELSIRDKQILQNVFELSKTYRK